MKEGNTKTWVGSTKELTQTETVASYNSIIPEWRCNHSDLPVDTAGYEDNDPSFPSEEEIFILEVILSSEQPE